MTFMKVFFTTVKAPVMKFFVKLPFYNFVFLSLTTLVPTTFSCLFKNFALYWSSQLKWFQYKYGARFFKYTISISTLPLCHSFFQTATKLDETSVVALSGIIGCQIIEGQFDVAKEQLDFLKGVFIFVVVV